MASLQGAAPNARGPSRPPPNIRGTQCAAQVRRAPWEQARRAAEPTPAAHVPPSVACAAEAKTLRRQVCTEGARAGVRPSASTIPHGGCVSGDFRRSCPVTYSRRAKPRECLHISHGFDNMRVPWARFALRGRSPPLLASPPMIAGG